MCGCISVPPGMESQGENAGHRWQGQPWRFQGRGPGAILFGEGILAWRIAGLPLCSVQNESPDEPGSQAAAENAVK